MKKALILSVMVIFSFCAVGSAIAKPAKCPQPRKTKAAPGSIAKKDKTKKANAKNGKKIFMKTAKPMACQMCHGPKGDGGGKLAAALKPAPRNFTCAATMKKISARQMFYIIKNGSKGRGMVAHGKTLKDNKSGMLLNTSVLRL